MTNNKRPPLISPSVILATWFGCGYLQPGPGTWGSLGALPFAAFLFWYAGMEGIIVAIIATLPLAFWASGRFDKLSSGHDAKEIVIDEVIGQWIALLPVLYFLNLDIKFFFLSFVLFRFFDILKPWPISWLDKNIKGAAGVMLDDILAGILAAICIYGIILYV